MSLASLIHVGEVAALLLVAYVVGCAIGYGLRRLTLRRPMVVAEAVAVAPAAVAVSASETAKPAAPVEIIITAAAQPQVDVATVPAAKVSAIESLKSLSATMPLMPGAAAPVVAAEVAPVAAVEPVPPPVAPSKSTDPGVVNEMASFAEATAAAKRMIEEALKPATVAPIVAAKPVVVERPKVTDPAPVPVAEAQPPAAPTAVEAPSEPQSAVPEPPVIVVPALPASLPGQAWAGEIHGHLAAASDSASAPAASSLPSDPEPGLPSVEDAVAAALIASIEQSITAIRPGERQRVAELTAPGSLAIVEAPVMPEPAAIEPAATIVEPEPVLPVSEPAAAEPEVAPLPPLPEPAVVSSSPLLEEPAASYPPPQEPVEFDEDAAMRDIEGGWSRRQTRAMSETPELTDVGAAVSAAQVAVEKILARNGVSADRQAAAGKPKGLPRPRDDRADNLRRINGLSGLDESTLNNLGVFHFDQVAAWDQKEVLWLENHAFARGRIGREAWQEQARALVAANSPLRASR